MEKIGQVPDSGRNENSLKIGKSLLWAFIVAILRKIFVFDFMIAEGNSMIPAIQSGTILLVSRIAYGIQFPWADTYIIRWSMPKMGDIVVFYTPLNTLAVKRYAGTMEGGKFIALGDNTVDSLDSRSYGPVPVDHIIGKVLGIK
jgi:signal peptidase I